MKNHPLYSKLPNISVIHSHIENFLATTSASAYWKDKKGAYLGVNDEFVKVSAMRSYDDAIGRTDLDLLWSEQAPIMMKNDQEIIHTRCTRTYVEPAKSPNNVIVHYLSHKTPLCSRMGKIIGTLGLSFVVDHENSVSTALNEVAFLIDDPIMRNKIKERALMSSASAHGLTKRQASCLYHLVRGMTMKQIAAALNLSPKTIEHYLDAVKIKLNCSSRSELIEKALQMGFGR